jgi:hypothetical protein
MRPVLVITCIQGPHLFKEHLVLSRKWLYHMLQPLETTSVKRPLFLGPDMVGFAVPYEDTRMIWLESQQSTPKVSEGVLR